MSEIDPIEWDEYPVSEIEKLIEERDQLRAEVTVWRDWWNQHGFAWYRDRGSPYDEKPSVLKANSEHYIGPKA